MPGCAVANKYNEVIWEGLRDFFQEEIHPDRVAFVGNGENLTAACWFYCSKRVAIFADMLAWHTRAYPLFTPAVAGLIAASEARLVLEQHANLAVTARFDNFRSLAHALVNFFEASHASSSAALGCRLLGITFRQPWRAKTLYT